jgi:hypothetical protein
MYQLYQNPQIRHARIRSMNRNFHCSLKNKVSIRLYVEVFNAKEVFFVTSISHILKIQIMHYFFIEIEEKRAIN